MEVIIEVVSRGGHIIERHRASGSRISIGRGFDNELIISDETVSPRHAVLVTDEGGNLVLADAGSLNGTRSDNHGKADRFRVVSGETYTLGRARIRVYQPGDPVAETVRVGELDGLINRLSSYGALLVLVAAVAVLTVVELWLNSYSGIQWDHIGIGLFGVFSAAAMIAIFLAIVGRVIKHEGRVQTQLALVLSYLLVQSAIVYVYELILFNTLNIWVSAVAGLAASYCLLAFVLWLCLHVATNLGSMQRWKFSFVVTTVLLCISVFPEIFSHNEFSDTPSYVKEVKPPVLRLAGNINSADFVRRTTAVFEFEKDEYE